MLGYTNRRVVPRMLRTIVLPEVNQDAYDQKEETESSDSKDEEEEEEMEENPQIEDVSKQKW